jgi:SAM-dependent methyltransferase
VTIYDSIGRSYAVTRRPDPRIEARIRAAVGDAQRVVNVGAGTGSYEPPGTVVAVEPSATMIAQRPPGAAPAIQASAEALPLPDDDFDVALAILTIHHWSDLERGFAELRRVARRAVVLTWDGDVGASYWFMRDYVPETIADDVARFPPIDRVVELLGGDADVEPVPVPHDCVDGFAGSHWRRPEAYLDPTVRANMSNLARYGDAVPPGIERLAADLASGAWHERYAGLLDLDELDLGYRLVASR